jgi:hypothetical protein
VIAYAGHRDNDDESSDSDDESHDFHLYDEAYGIHPRISLRAGLKAKSSGDGAAKIDISKAESQGGQLDAGQHVDTPK